MKIFPLLLEKAHLIGNILRAAFERFSKHRAPEAAAGMAFYAMFGLFPLLLFLIAVGSFILELEQARERVLALVLTVIPTSQELVVKNLEQVLRLRGTMGAIAVVSLLWSASGFFAILGHQINRIWPRASTRSPVKRRLLGIGMVSALALLLILWLGFTAVLELLPRLSVSFGESLQNYRAPLHAFLSRALHWVFPFLLFFFLYWFIPNTKVPVRVSLWGALVATLAWKVATMGFIWYLSSGLSRYQLVYGSLGSVIALMFWIYLSSLILLFGAHLSAVLSERVAIGLEGKKLLT